MRQREWYVIQVQPGHESQMCELVEGLCAEADAKSDIDGYHLLDECFSPRFRTQSKRMGEWKDIERTLLPGYVIAVTSEPGELQRLLRSIPDFARLLTMGETYTPLSKEERLWVERNTKKGDRVVPMSVGYKVDDRLVVSEGPLQGLEGLVTGVRRKKSLASLEFHVGQMTIKTTVGLAIVPRPRETAE